MKTIIFLFSLFLLTISGNSQTFILSGIDCLGTFDEYQSFEQVENNPYKIRHQTSDSSVVNKIFNILSHADEFIPDSTDTLLDGRVAMSLFCLKGNTYSILLDNRGRFLYNSVVYFPEKELINFIKLNFPELKCW